MPVPVASYPTSSRPMPMAMLVVKKPLLLLVLALLPILLPLLLLVVVLLLSRLFYPFLISHWCNIILPFVQPWLISTISPALSLFPISRCGTAARPE